MNQPVSIPVTIVTGFLGSGKTTLLNRLLKRPSLADTVVIVNEFGEVGLDHLLIEQAIENTVLLKNGCICCTVRGDVADTLAMLWRQRADGIIPPFGRIVIETTGLADPGAVAQALVAGPGDIYACHLDGIVTTLDAVHGLHQVATREEARRQLALADLVLLTKADLASANETSEARRVAASWNPVAAALTVTNGDPGDAALFGLGGASWARLGMTGETGHRHFHHDAQIGSILLTRDTPVAWDALARWLDSLLSLRGADVLRIKGLVDVAGIAAPVVLQAVHQVVHPAVRLPAWPGGRAMTELVVIHQGLPESGVRASWREALSGQ